MLTYFVPHFLIFFVFLSLKTRVEGCCSPLRSSYTAFQLEEQADYDERDNEGSVI